MQGESCGTAKMDRKDRLIEIISASSDRRGDLLLELMDQYGLWCIREATEEQLREFIEERMR